MFGFDEPGFCPGVAAIRTFPYAEREILPLACITDALEMQDIASVCQQGAPRHVPVGDFVKPRSGLPAAFMETRLQDDHFASGFGIGGEPDSQQVEGARTSFSRPGDGRLMVMGIEGRQAVRRGNDVGNRFQKDRFPCASGHLGPSNRMSGQSAANPDGFFGTLYHPETQQDRTVCLDGRGTIGAPEIPHRGVVAAPADDAEFRVTIIVSTPLLHIPMHVIQAPRIRLELSYL